jgi:aspartate aminotransferase-like enzyme
MPALLDTVDPDGLLEYSVVFTDRSLNHMSQQFQHVMRDIHTMLTSVYAADSVAIVPGGGTYAMEAVARQFAGDKDVLILRNGWFSYRWTQILDTGNIAASSTVMKAQQQRQAHQSAFAPAAIAEVVAQIERQRPAVIFAPHVETSSGMMLPDEYIAAVGAAAQAAGSLFVLDCIASGTVWVDMKSLNVDVLISAPQKGWSATPCAGLVQFGARALEVLPNTQSSSFSCDLKKWHDIMQAYVAGGHAYHATMPTDGLKQFRDTMEETAKIGFDHLKSQQILLGGKIRALLAECQIQSVAADGFGAPGVVVNYTDDPDISTGKKFLGQGLQIAAGVPLMCDEPADFRTFRLGLFGLDKLQNVDRTVQTFEQALDNLI